MKSTSLLIFVLLGNLSLHAIQFDKALKPVMQVYSVMAIVPWQKIFNVGIVGALGWLGYENWQLRKSNLKSNFDPNLYLKINDTQGFATTKQLEDLSGLFMLRSAGITREEAATLYLQKSEATNFVQKTEEEKNELAKAIVSITLPIFNKQFVNINGFNGLTDQVNTIKEELVKVQKNVDNCVTREDLKEIFKEQTTTIDKNFQNFQKMLTQYQEEQTETNNRFNKLQTDFEKSQEAQKDINSGLALTLKQGLEHINATIQGLASNQDFILRLAPNVAGLLTQEDQDAPDDNQTHNVN